MNAAANIRRDFAVDAAENLRGTTIHQRRSRRWRWGVAATRQSGRDAGGAFRIARIHGRFDSRAKSVDDPLAHVFFSLI
jgi:hypothetical protein